MITSVTEATRSSEVPEIHAVVHGLRLLAIRALSRMYRPEEKLFGFHIRRTRRGNILEGVSRRYTAIALIGLAGEGEDVSFGVLSGRSPEDVCSHLIEETRGTSDLGEAALCLWAARMIDHREADKALRKLQAMDPACRDCPTVELAWCLSALMVEGSDVVNGDLARLTARRLMDSFRTRSCLFPHRPIGSSVSRFREHIGCFADQVYPIQALSLYHLWTGDEESLVKAQACADRICELQGTHGQWWWHYDVRTGRVVEPYPVYAVHQDAMAPMALFALQKAGGKDYRPFVERGMMWLADPPERRTCLIDGRADLIWRKVARHEPRRLSRGLQTLASVIHPSFRVPGLDLVLRPGAVDYECRPYHMGWLLYAWSQDCASNIHGG